MAQAAHISKAQGSVIVTRDGQDITLKQGDALFESDVIKTDAQSVEITFADNSIATLGPKTVMALKDFAYEGGEEPTFVMELVTGAMRTISGAVVEQNPDAFKVLTPRATVGIRGTTFLTIVNPDKSETVIVIGLDAGHNLVVTTHSGQQISMGDGNQGVTLGAEADAALVPRAFAPQEINDIVQNIMKSLGLVDDDNENTETQDDVPQEDDHGNDDENKGVEEENSDGSDQVSILLDEAALGEANVKALAEALEEVGIEVVIVTDNPENVPFEENKPDNEYYDPTEESTDAPHTVLRVETTGNENFFADSTEITTEDFSTRGHYISVTGDTSEAVTISGDVNVISGGTVHASDDFIVGQNMSNGTMVGDALSMTGGTLMAGNDTLSVINKTGGQSIYGDVKDLSASGANAGRVSFGDDSITVTGNFYNSVISGDTASVPQGFTVERWGDDNIVVEGDMGNANSSTTIYGDASGADSVGGHDEITVEGTMTGQGTAIYAGGGDDLVNVTVMEGGLVHTGTGKDKVFVEVYNDSAMIMLGSGADEVTIQESSAATARIDVGLDSDADSVTLNGSGSIIIKNFNIAHDTLTVNGQEYAVTGNDTYGDYTVTFEDSVGTNHAPTLSVDVADDSVTAGSDNTASGQITFGDVDSDGSTLTVNGTPINTTSGASTTISGMYGNLVVNADGAFTYTAGVTAEQQDALDKLNTGDAPVESFSVLNKDPHGEQASGVIEITVNGANDAPVVDVDASNIAVFVTEKGEGGNTDRVDDESASPAVTATGTIVATDAESDTIEFSVTGTPDASLGEFTIDKDSGEYTFTLNDAAADRLYAGEKVTETYEITVTDNKGGSVTQEVDVTITGTNDTPTLSVNMADDSVTEGGDNTASGQITFDDVDSDGSTLTVNNTTIDTTSGANTTITGMYGNLVVNADGSFLYTAGVTSEQQAALDTLGAGDAPVESFDVRNEDQHGAYSEGTIDITVNGANDAPVVDVDASGIAVSVTEKGEGGNTDRVDDESDSPPVTAKGTIVVTDAEGDPLEFSVTGTPDASLGEFTIDTSGAYTFTLNDAAADKLYAGEKVTETYEITVTDNKGGSVTQDVEVTITGTNDTPTLSVVMTDDSVTFGSDNTASGTLTFDDVDSDGSTLTVNNTSIDTTSGASTTITGTYGNLVVNADGTFTYTSGVTDTQLAALRNLGGGASVTESFDVLNRDAHDAYSEGTIDITVTASANPPTLTFTEDSDIPNDGNITLIEGYVEPSVTISATDGNTGAEIGSSGFTVSRTEDSVTTGVGGAWNGTTYGTVRLVQNGRDIQYEYDVNSFDEAMQNLLPGQVVTDTFYIHVVDALGHKISHKVSVEINADGTFSYTGTAGNDTLTIPGSWDSGTITGNGGNDTFKLWSDTSSVTMNAGTSITTTDGDDRVDVEHMDGGSVNVGEGTNTLVFNSVGSSISGTIATVTAGSGVDTFTADSLSHDASVNLGAGNNIITLGIANGADTSLITLGGDDTLTVNSNVTGIDGPTTINLGDGANEVHIKGWMTGDVTLTTGNGNDAVTVDGELTGHINVGDGTNEVTVGSMPGTPYTTWGSITGGAGDDTFTVTGNMVRGTITTGNGTNEVTVGSMSGLAEIEGGIGTDTVTVLGAMAGMAAITTGGGNDILAVTDMQAGTITAGAGADTITVGGTSVSGTIDVADGTTNDTDADSVYLTAGGAGSLTIKNFDASQDVLYHDNVRVDVTSSSLTVGGYTITFEGLANAKPLILFDEDSDTPDDGSIKVTEGDELMPVGITATAFGGNPATLYAIHGDTSATSPADEPDKQGVGSEVSGDYGYLTLNSAGNGYTYMADGTSFLTPGQVVTDTFTIYAVDASNVWTSKVITVEVTGDHNFTGTAAADTWTVAGTLSGGTVIGNGGNDTFTLGAMEGGSITTTDGDDNVTITGTMTNGTINLGEGINSLTIGGAIGDSSINVDGGTNTVTLNGTIIDGGVVFGVGGTSKLTVNLADKSGADEALNMSLVSAKAGTEVLIMGGTATDTYNFITTGAENTTVTIMTSQNSIDFTQFYVDNSIQSVSAGSLIVGEVNFVFEAGMEADSLSTSDTLANSGFTYKNHIVGVGDNRLVISNLTALDFLVVGDAENVPTAAAAGSDTIILAGDLSTGQSIYGDVFDVKNGNVSTADTLTVDGNLTAGRLVGDAGDLGSDTGVTGITQTITISGHDVLTVYGNMSKETSYGSNVIGDVAGVDIDSGNNPNEKAVISGNDIITVYGAFSGGNIFGDVETVFSNDDGDSSTVLISGSDTIIVHGGMTGGSIFGDASGTNSTTVTGADTITIHAGMSGGVISGDIDNVNGGPVLLQGHDTINIYGNMTGGSIIYGDTRTLQDGTSEGNDSITVHGKISGATIYGDGGTLAGDDSTKGDDNITVKGDMDAASVIYGDANRVSTLHADKDSTGHDTLIVEGNMTGNSVIYGDAQTLSASSGVGKINFTGYDTITVHGNMSSAKIYGDMGELLGNVTATGDDTITVKGVMSGTVADTLIDGGAGADTISVGATNAGMTGGTINTGDDTDADSLTVFVGNATQDAIQLTVGAEDSVYVKNGGVTRDTHVSVDVHDNKTSVKLFEVDGVDITAGVNSALAGGSSSYAHDLAGGYQLTIHFD